MRHLTTLALAGLFGGLLLTSDASACHKKKCACPAPAPVCAPAPPPVCAPAPVCEAPRKKCHVKMPKMKMGCHKKAAACAPVAYSECAAPGHYAAPSYAAPSYAAPVYAAPQASGQGS